MNNRHQVEIEGNAMRSAKNEISGLCRGPNSVIYFEKMSKRFQLLEGT